MSRTISQLSGPRHRARRCIGVVRVVNLHCSLGSWTSPLLGNQSYPTDGNVTDTQLEPHGKRMQPNGTWQNASVNRRRNCLSDSVAHHCMFANSPAPSNRSAFKNASRLPSPDDTIEANWSQSEKFDIWSGITALRLMFAP
jgi:hypothetical protein